MLVLGRRVGDSIVIIAPTGERIEVSIEEVRGNTVRAGIVAPLQFAIYRNENQPPVSLPVDQLESKRELSSTL